MYVEIIVFERLELTRTIAPFSLSPHLVYFIRHFKVSKFRILSGKQKGRANVSALFYLYSFTNTCACFFLIIEKYLQCFSLVEK